MLFQWFFYGKKDENSYFSDQKLFTSLTSFLPPFFYIGDSLKIEFEHANYQYSKQKKGGKKLVDGGKKLLFNNIDLIVLLEPFIWFSQRFGVCLSILLFIGFVWFDSDR